MNGAGGDHIESDSKASRFRATTKGYVEIARMLLEKGAESHRTNGNGVPTLHDAADAEDPRHQLVSETDQHSRDTLILSLCFRPFTRTLPPSRSSPSMQADNNIRSLVTLDNLQHSSGFVDHDHRIATILLGFTSPNEGLHGL
jgi:hypothetical protein